MDQIFVIFGHYQGHDSDHWQHWIGISPPISYHRTMQGAKGKIAKLLEGKPNSIQLTESMNADGEYKEYPLLIIEPIKLEP